ncbi:hypothetical protein [Novosphingobium sp.]|uniref:hypothetical protein n=1 Tax=Novosphingobium sp. TaxID=1874826 RepID=UPI0025E4AB8C|nr:hypothetical protein [Novosphingobium sp.]
MLTLRKAAILAASISLAYATPVLADDYPVEPGDYVSIGMISIEDGHDLEYMNYLSGLWRRNQDYAKAQGWITSYEILTNENRRAGEPDVYLVTRFKEFANTAEDKRRSDLMQAQMKMTDAEMQAASAGRAKYRTQMGSQLLRAWVWKK